MSETPTSVLSPSDLTAAVLGLRGSIDSRDTRFDHVDSRLDQIDARLADLTDHARKHDELLDEVRDEMHGELGEVRSRLVSGFKEAGAEFAQTDRAVDAQLSRLRADITDGFTQVHSAIRHLRMDVDGRFALSRGEIDVRFARVHEEMETRFDNVHGEIDQLRGEIGHLRTDMDARFARVHGEMETRFGKVHGEIGQLRTDMDRRFDGVHAQVRAIAEAVGAPIVEAPTERRN